jgi:hypothetical protein
MPAKFSRFAAAVVVIVTLGLAPGGNANEPVKSRPLWSVDAWRASPFHAQFNADGQRMPCRCVFQGKEYRVGEIVCMNTHQGVVLTRCDMSLNNTTWVPSEEPCPVSSLPEPKGPPMSRIRAAGLN